jgi:hypothetical protein
MCEFDCLNEDRLIWTRTKDEIEKRWELFVEWGLTSRIAKLFGGSESKKETKIKPPEMNDENTLQTLDLLFGGDK